MATASNDAYNRGDFDTTPGLSAPDVECFPAEIAFKLNPRRGKRRLGAPPTHRGDYDAIMRLFAPDIVCVSLDALGVFEGAMAEEARAAAIQLAEERG